MMSSDNDNDNGSSLPPQPSPIQVSMLAARRTLWNGHPPSIMAWALDPLRVWALDPILSINSVLLPAVTPAPINPAVALFVDVVCVPVLSSLYWPGAADLGDEASDDDKVNEAAKISLGRPTIVAVRPPSDVQSAFQGSISFVCSAIGDVVGLATNPKKFQGWVGALSQFNTFLTQSGVGDEMEESIQKPLLGGRLLDNFKILNDIQEICHHDRIETTQHDQPIDDLEDDIRHGHRLMRFATAAYGSEMVRSAIDVDVDASKFLDDSNPFKAIAIHTRLDDECIKFVHAGNDHDFDQHVLHHFVAVDHGQKSVVLAIRGTLSLSGAIIDIQGMSVPFCEEAGIRAQCHKGIADVAKNIWNQSGERIESILQEYRDYKFVITGHSLGAGTSCLLTLYLCVKDIIPESRQMECYAFAPPPTFFLEESMSNQGSKGGYAKIARAIRNTVAYVHDNDVVPFLSVASVRRLITLLDTVDNETENIWFWKRWRMFYEYDKIPESITNKVIEAEKNMLEDSSGGDVCRAVDGECNLVIPARRIVWCKHKVAEGSFEAYSCDPHKVARGNIFLTPDMLSDHLPEQYEDALDNIFAQYDSQ